MRTCTFEGCEKPHLANGLCGGHRSQFRRGRPLTPIRVSPTECGFTGCPNAPRTKGYCQGHYVQSKKGQPLTPLKVWNRNPDEFCSFRECGRPHQAKGYCKQHWAQWTKGNELTPIRELRTGCTYPECLGVHYGRGLCSKHWQFEHGRSYKHNRRYQELAAGEMPKDAYQSLLAQHGPYCLYPWCLVRTGLQIDHVVPLSRGGSNELDNLQLLCGYHNRSKLTQSTDYRLTV